jgi:hypothetical protein
MNVNRSFKISQMLMIGLLIAAIWYANASSMFSGVLETDSVSYYSRTLDGPFVAHVLEVDMLAGDVAFKAWRSGGLITTSRQLRDAGFTGMDVHGGINADFFSFQSTLPIGNQVTDGEFVYGIHSRRSHVLVRASGEVSFESVSFSGGVTTRDGANLLVTGVNRHRAEDQAMFYNKHYHGVSRNDSTGVEMAMRLVSGDRWIAGNTVRVVVDSVKVGYMNATPGQYLISVGPRHPHYSRYSTVSTADTLTLTLGFTDSSITDVTQVIGGGGRILRDGIDATHENEEKEGIASAFLTNRHPRSVVAVNKDQSVAWLVVIDGRQASSLGMNFAEMASFLQDLGAWDAINLDGGGSTTMVYNNQVVNSPSDPTGERAVANVLMVVGQ